MHIWKYKYSNLFPTYGLSYVKTLELNHHPNEVKG